MPSPSYAQLQKENQALKRRLADLSTDPRYNVTRRNAIPYLDLTNVTHAVTLIFPPNTQQGDIKRLLRGRWSANIVERAIWDEQTFVLFLRGEPEDLVDKLKASAAKAGTYPCIHAMPYSSVSETVLNAQAIHNAHANGYQY